MELLVLRYAVCEKLSSAEMTFQVVARGLQVPTLTAWERQSDLVA